MMDNIQNTSKSLVQHVKALPRWLKIWTGICWSVIALILALWVITPGDMDVFWFSGGIALTWLMAIAAILCSWYVTLLTYVWMRSTPEGESPKFTPISVLAIILTFLISTATCRFSYTTADENTIARGADMVCDGTKCYHTSYDMWNIYSWTVDLYLHECDYYHFLCRRIETNTTISASPEDDDIDLILDGDRVIVEEYGEPVFIYENGEVILSRYLND